MAISTSRPIDAIVAGYLGVDIAPGFARRENASFAELFRPGKLIETEGLHFSLGGVVPNTGLAMRRFGCNTELMGCIGIDTLGDLALEQLVQAGVSQGIRRIKSAGTAYGIVIAPPGMDRVFFEAPGCNRVFTADDIDYEVVAKSRLFHFGYPPLMDVIWANDGKELTVIFERVHQRDTVTSLDMTLPDPDTPAGQVDWNKILSNVLPLTDIFVPSIEELLFMLEPQLYRSISEQATGNDMIEFIPEDEYRLLAKKVLSMGVEILLIKAGHKGAFLMTGNLSGLNSLPLKLSDEIGCQNGIWLPSLPVNTDRFCNASGAGDCAVAGFLTALLNDESIINAGQYAMITGRDNLYGKDAFSGLRTWTEVTRGLQSTR
jgi:sugar/nucleoside kinase (ribokinase family)